MYEICLRSNSWNYVRLGNIPTEFEPIEINIENSILTISFNDIVYAKMYLYLI